MVKGPKRESILWLGRRVACDIPEGPLEPPVLHHVFSAVWGKSLNRIWERGGLALTWFVLRHQMSGCPPEERAWMNEAWHSRSCIQALKCPLTSQGTDHIVNMLFSYNSL